MYYSFIRYCLPRTRFYQHHDYFSFVNFPRSHFRNMCSHLAISSNSPIFRFFRSLPVNRVSSFKITNCTTLGCFDYYCSHSQCQRLFKSMHWIHNNNNNKKRQKSHFYSSPDQNFNSVYLVLFKFFVFTSPTNVCTTCVNHRPWMQKNDRNVTRCATLKATEKTIFHSWNVKNSTQRRFERDK